MAYPSPLSGIPVSPQCHAPAITQISGVIVTVWSLFASLFLFYQMWGWFNEKSKQSKKIEDAICKRFDELRFDIDAARCHRDTLSVLAIGCKSKESPLRILPGDVMRRITSYLDIPCSSSTRRRRVFDGLLKPRISTEMSTTMFEPGSVTVIPIARHPFHLTRPCYRDFARYVRSFGGFHSSRADVDAINIVYKTPQLRPTNSRGGCQIESIARSVYLAMVVAIESDVEDAILFQTALDVGFSRAFILSLKGRGGNETHPDEDCDGMEGCDE